jgi:hypothetical protein
MTKPIASYFFIAPFNSFDMAALNDHIHFHLAGDVIDQMPSLDSPAAYTK